MHENDHIQGKCWTSMNNYPTGCKVLMCELQWDGTPGSYCFLQLLLNNDFYNPPKQQNSNTSKLFNTAHSHRLVLTECASWREWFFLPKSTHLDFRIPNKSCLNLKLKVWLLTLKIIAALNQLRVATEWNPVMRLKESYQRSSWPRPQWADHRRVKMLLHLTNVKWADKFC